jgi:hypothetical protein|nr:MAG TPA: hypothetical protein [Caudoviricetes sp.]
MKVDLSYMFAANNILSLLSITFGIMCTPDILLYSSIVMVSKACWPVSFTKKSPFLFGSYAESYITSIVGS